MYDIEIVYKGDRESDLLRLNREANNTNLPLYSRKMAADARDTILDQLRDKKLVSLRREYIKATRAGDLIEGNKLQLRIREHMKEPMETGDY